MSTGVAYGCEACGWLIANLALQARQIAFTTVNVTDQVVHTGSIVDEASLARPR